MKFKKSSAVHFDPKMFEINFWEQLGKVAYKKITLYIQRLNQIQITQTLTPDYFTLFG